eukprot:scaffold156435_cov24-Tisochrysis_lutea.AAC.2
MSSSGEPTSKPSWRSEKPDFLACRSVAAGSVSFEYSERIARMSEMRLSFHRNHGSMDVSWWMRSTVQPRLSASAMA